MKRERKQHCKLKVDEDKCKRRSENNISIYESLIALCHVFPFEFIFNSLVYCMIFYCILNKHKINFPLSENFPFSNFQWKLYRKFLYFFDIKEWKFFQSFSSMRWFLIENIFTQKKTRNIIFYIQMKIDSNMMKTIKIFTFLSVIWMLFFIIKNWLLFAIFTIFNIFQM